MLRHGRCSRFAIDNRHGLLKSFVTKREDENRSSKTLTISAKKRVIKANVFQEDLLVAIYFKDEAYERSGRWINTSVQYTFYREGSRRECVCFQYINGRAVLAISVIVALEILEWTNLFSQYCNVRLKSTCNIKSRYTSRYTLLIYFL